MTFDFDPNIFDVNFSRDQTIQYLCLLHRYGKKAKNTLKSKARLFAEKINKEERKNKAELIAEPPGKEPNSFWETLGYDGEMPYVPQVSALVEVILFVIDYLHLLLTR